MTHFTRPLIASLLIAIVAGTTPGAAAPPADSVPPWREAEAGALADQVQLTFPDQFFKAGESYFSPDDRRVIFQAIPKPPEGSEPGEVYSMYVADVVRDDRGRVAALDGVRQISPPGSANTCGWFHPKDPDTVLFATTLGTPSPGSPPGYDRKTGRYRWMFPPEMRIVRGELDGDLSPDALVTVAGTGTAYCAEGAVSPDGRHLVYCSLESGGGDLHVLDLRTGDSVPVVVRDGYDGGPFFSPDGRRICYRSDRRGDHHLQLFVADLVFDKGMHVTGTAREYQLTDNTHVNWGPFWHPGGRHLVYATSEMGHRNYEVFLIDADPGHLPGSNGAIKYGTRKRRVTHSERADVLPAFSHDGKTMIWTSQRGADGKSQLWAADFLMELDPAPEAPSYPGQRPGSTRGEGR